MMTNSFLPAKLNFPLFKGSTFRYLFQWLDDNGHERKPHDITGYTGIAKLLGPSQEVLHELTTANGKIKFGSEPSLAFVELYIDKADTSAFEWKKAVYTLFLTEGSPPPEATEPDTFPMLTGVFTVSSAGSLQ